MQDAKVAAGHGTAGEDVAGGLVYGEVRVGLVVLDGAFEQTSGAGEAAPLAADEWEIDSVGGRGVEDVLIGVAGD